MHALHPELISGNGDRQFRIKDRTLAILDLAIPFHIIQISANGLVFRYVGNEQWFNDPGKLDIIYEGFSLRDLPVQTLADYRIPTDMVRIRHHCVKFDGLSPAQITQLDQLIGLCAQ